jgi:hypothetical protein
MLHVSPGALKAPLEASAPLQEADERNRTATTIAEMVGVYQTHLLFITPALHLYVPVHLITRYGENPMDRDDEKDQIPLFGEVKPRTTFARTSRAMTAPKSKPEPGPKEPPARKAALPGKKATAKKVVASGQVPTGDVRLTANIREDLHLRLKIAAARQRTTIGELIEGLVERHLPPV